MPELPEVEVVRSGLEHHLLGAEFLQVVVLHPRAVRDHRLGTLPEFLCGTVITAVRRRGKFLWFELCNPGDPVGITGGADAKYTNKPRETGRSPQPALIAHLGMSGQMLVRDPSPTLHPHVRIAATLRLSDGTKRQLLFQDQRTFGRWSGDQLVLVEDSGIGQWLPASISHIAVDPLDWRWKQADGGAAVNATRRLRARRTEVKRALLDQTLVSGIGNIYADEALWQAQLHPATPTASLTEEQAGAVLDAARQVMLRALEAGGTSFDALYVDVDGASGYFARSLNAYGRHGQPCPRCGELLRREVFGGRSAHFCLRCQPRPPA